MNAPPGAGNDPRRALEPGEVRAWLFDLDGVITDTASLHRAAWRALFDAFLAEYTSTTGRATTPFSDDDYTRYIDGRLREDGVRSFLSSRDIDLPVDTGAAERPGSSDRPSVAGLAAQKDERFQALLRSKGVTVYPDGVALVRAMKGSGRPTALVTASRNATEVLSSAGLVGLFDPVVDGVVAASRHLAGKPRPDLFLAAAAAVGCAAPQCAVVEDAPAGVEAGRAGGFGLVVGVDRRGIESDLRAAGADLVVRELTELLATPPRGGGR